MEKTFMRFGHSQSGLTGITLNENATQRWALSLHSCSILVHDIEAMRDAIAQDTTSHKEETPGRVKANASDREKLRSKLAQCLNPLDPSGHPPEMFNIVTGQLACSSVNVHNALSKGRESLDKYES